MRQQPDQDPSEAPQASYSDLPAVHITVNQLIAHNLALYRRAAGLTQEELGERLAGWVPKPWSKAAVSAAERSWDGKRVRQFDADLILGLAIALHVPVPALFLPPEDDGVARRYLIDPPHPTRGDTFAGCSSMRDLLGYVLSDPSDDEDPAALRYRQRFLAALEFHYPGLIPDDYLAASGSKERISARIGRMRRQRDALRSLLVDLDEGIDALNDRIEEMPNAPDEKGEG